MAGVFGDRYFSDQNIGRGAYGQVHSAVDLLHPDAAHLLALYRAHGLAVQAHLSSAPRSCRVAVKRLTNRDANRAQYPLREVSILQRIREAQEAVANPGASELERAVLQGARYCIQLRGSIPRPSGFPTIVTELCECNLHDFLHMFANSAMPPCCIRTFMGQILEALTFLHEGIGVIHRDLKPPNIVLALVYDPAADTHRGSQSALPIESPSSERMRLTPEADPTTEPRVRIQASDDLPSTPEGCVASSQMSEHPPTQPKDVGGDFSARDTPGSMTDTSATRRCIFCGCTQVADVDTSAAFEGHPDAPPVRFERHPSQTAQCADQQHRALLERQEKARALYGSLTTLLTPRDGSTLVPRLEVRICDFGSATFVGPQPFAASHLREEALNESCDVAPSPRMTPGQYPSCTSRQVVDHGPVLHAMAATATSICDNTHETVASLPMDYIAAVNRAYVSHGCATLPYRAPEDLLSATGNHPLPAFHQGEAIQPLRTHVSSRTKVRLGPALDVWAAGCILGELLCGKVLIEDDTGLRTQDDNDMQEQSASWAHLMAIFKLTGAPQCGPTRSLCDHRHGDETVGCTSMSCWPGLSSIISKGCFTNPQLQPLLRDRSQAQRPDGGLAAFPMLKSRLGRLGEPDAARKSVSLFAPQSLAYRCVQVDLLNLGLHADLVSAERPRHAMVSELALDISRCISPETSPTFDLLSRLLMLDPSRRISAADALHHDCLQQNSVPSV